MPWDGKSFKDRHNHGLTPKQAQKAASVANAVLNKTGDESLAIKVANAQARDGKYRSNR